MKNIQKEYPEVTSDDSARAIFRKVPQTIVQSYLKRKIPVEKPV